MVTLVQSCSQLVTKEFYAVQTSTEKRISELETVLNEKSSQLATYEKLEHELDQVVMQAADGTYSHGHVSVCCLYSSLRVNLL